LRDYMNFLEMQSLALNFRTQKIDKTPDEKQYKSNKLLYEILKDIADGQLAAVNEGRLLAYSHGLDDILVPMGFTCFMLISAADRVGPMAEEYYRLVRGAGYPTTICDRFQMAMGLVLSGDVPRPHLIASGQACDVETLCNIAAAHIWEVPYYFIDFRYRMNLSIEHVMDQIYEMIDRIERTVPGAKFDQEIFMERYNSYKTARGYFHEMGQLLKTTPAPISAKDAFRIVSPRIAKMHPRGLEYVRELRDEIRNRVERGFSPCPNEKLRILWAVSGPYFGNLFKVLEKHDASMPIFLWSHTPETYGLTPNYFYDVGVNIGREPTPMEEVTSSLLSTWTGPASVWVDEIVCHCKELQIDGVVYYQLSGCPTNRPVARMVSDRLEEELSIPTLPLEGWMVDKERYDASGSEDKLDAFLTMCYQRKKAGT
jgi:benzoyl-CoA reductase/2-hydroxyglutaryl-CoA dehydratase subunit BcrC/BadD/HgdB